MNWATLESSLHPEPAFPVEPPDGRKTWSEIQRAVGFRQEMRARAPQVMLYANANAGKRNPRQAMREGVRAGVFDYTAVWSGGAAWIELKGYTAAGRPGSLSAAQIEFGNRLVALGHRAACFFSPERAIDWLRECGAPVAGVRI